MSRVQLALRVADLEASVAFYAKLDTGHDVPPSGDGHWGTD